MTDHARIIDDFYEAFAAGDAERMVAWYHPEIRFSDPVFPELRSDEARDMWRMLTANPSSRLRVEHRDVRVDGDRGSARWEARYAFGGRPVHNVIDAEFTFREGKILTHTDRFDFPRWAAQALGLPGKVLGRTEFMRRKVRGMAARRLEAFRAGRTGG